MASDIALFYAFVSFTISDKSKYLFAENRVHLGKRNRRTMLVATSLRTKFVSRATITSSALYRCEKSRFMDSHSLILNLMKL